MVLGVRTREANPPYFESFSSRTKSTKYKRPRHNRSITWSKKGRDAAKRLTREGGREREKFVQESHRSDVARSRACIDDTEVLLSTPRADTYFNWNDVFTFRLQLSKLSRPQVFMDKFSDFRGTMYFVSRNAASSQRDFRNRRFQVYFQGARWVPQGGRGRQVFAAYGLDSIWLDSF